MSNLPEELKQLVEIIVTAEGNALEFELDDSDEIECKMKDLSLYQTQSLQRLQNLEKYYRP